MRKLFSLFLMLIIGVQVLRAQHANVVWNTPSRNSSESMPCGGGDIGLNVWVENGDLLFYISRSGTFDEHNCQLKQGRVRMRLTPNPFASKDGFRQELKLNDGYVEVSKQSALKPGQNTASLRTPCCGKDCNKSCVDGPIHLALPKRL